MAQRTDSALSPRCVRAISRGRARADDSAHCELAKLRRKNCLPLVQQCADGLRILQVHPYPNRYRPKEGRAGCRPAAEQFSDPDWYPGCLQSPGLRGRWTDYLRIRSGDMERMASGDE